MASHRYIASGHGKSKASLFSEYYSYFKYTTLCMDFVYGDNKCIPWLTKAVYYIFNISFSAALEDTVSVIL